MTSSGSQDPALASTTPTPPSPTPTTAPAALPTSISISTMIAEKPATLSASFASPAPVAPASPASPASPAEPASPVAELAPSQRSQSQATLTNPLPDGCSYGELEKDDSDDDSPPVRVIWVDFPPDSPDNPLYFPQRRKIWIYICTLIYTWWASATQTGFSISIPDMCAELGCTPTQSSAGVGLYAWGAALTPLVVAPFSEEFGRRPVYLVSFALFWLFHLVNAVAKNTATVLVARFIAGMGGSIGTSIVGGTIADMYIPAHRGLPMLISGFCLYFSTGIGGVMYAFVLRLGWRWVWWVHIITLGALLPLFIFVMPETRSSILLKRRAAKLRKERGLADGGRYMSHDEVKKENFSTALRESIERPLLFLCTEPIVIFFAVWIALAWGLFYVQIGGLPYIMRTIYGFNTEQVGLTYLTMVIGSCVALVAGRIQERVYHKKVAKHGVEARLYGPMVAGVIFAIGCLITGATASPKVHWIGCIIGQVIVIASVMTIYVTAFTYVAECYGTYASSAMAAHSCSRNLTAGAIAMATTPMLKRLTPRWSLIMMGLIGVLLAAVPYIAFWYGPRIRARSKWCRVLMHREHEALEAERAQREMRGIALGELGEDLGGELDGECDGHEEEDVRAEHKWGGGRVGEKEIV